MTQHIAWRGHTDEQASIELLCGEDPFTYFLRAGKDSYHYFLSYVDANRLIQQQLITIEFSVRKWLYRNGFPHNQETLDELIPCVLHCTAQECKPLQS